MDGKRLRGGCDAAGVVHILEGFVAESQRIIDSKAVAGDEARELPEVLEEWGLSSLAEVVLIGDAAFAERPVT